MNLQIKPPAELGPNVPALSPEDRLTAAAERTDISLRERAHAVFDLSGELLQSSSSPSLLATISRCARWSLVGARLDGACQVDAIQRAEATFLPVFVKELSALREPLSLRDLLDVGKMFLAFSWNKPQAGSIIGSQLSKLIPSATPGELLDIVGLMPKLHMRETATYEAIAQRVVETKNEWSFGQLSKAIFSLADLKIVDRRLHEEFKRKILLEKITLSNVHKVLGAAAQFRLEGEETLKPLVEAFLDLNQQMPQSQFCDSVRSLSRLRLKGEALLASVEQGTERYLEELSGPEAISLGIALTRMDSANDPLITKLASRISQLLPEITSAQSASRLAMDLYTCRQYPDSHIFDAIARVLEDKLSTSSSAKVGAIVSILVSAKIKDRQLWAAISRRRAELLSANEPTAQRPE